MLDRTAYAALVKTAISLLLVLAGAACGSDAQVRSPAETQSSTPGAAEPPNHQSAAMSGYIRDVLAPLDVGVRMLDENTAVYYGSAYEVDNTEGFAELVRDLFFDLGDLALEEIDHIGVEPFELWPLCIAATAWVMDQIQLSQVAAGGDELATLAAAMVLAETTRTLSMGVKAELGTIGDATLRSPRERIDPGLCDANEQEARKARGWPTND